MRSILALMAITMGVFAVEAAAEEPVKARGIVLEETHVSYAFEASVLGRAGKAMLKAAPLGANGNPNAGQVDSEWSLRLKPSATETQCGVQDVTITVSTTITTPDWSDVEDLEPDAQKEWDRYLTALRTYQDGHIAITVEMAKDIRSALLALPAQPTCSDLQAEMAQTAARIEADYADTNAAYDKRTNYGKKLGAVLRKQFTRRG
ncbi:MAG: DUF922 domain-containing protein [Pseudomonadota bacterium]